jgi:phosphoglycerate dehydrogenase-like enzyme
VNVIITPHAAGTPKANRQKVLAIWLKTPAHAGRQPLVNVVT